jgi:hypothetical protein
LSNDGYDLVWLRYDGPLKEQDRDQSSAVQLLAPAAQDLCLGLGGQPYLYYLTGSPGQAGDLHQAVLGSYDNVIDRGVVSIADASNGRINVMQADGYLRLYDGSGWSLLGAPSLVLISQQGQVAGAGLSLLVDVLNPYGQVATCYTGTISFNANDPSAILPGSYTFTAADQGRHTFLANIFRAYSHTITAADTTGAVTGSTVLQINPGPAVGFNISTPSSITAGTSVLVILNVFDAYGNVATGYTATVSFSSNDPNNGLPASYTFTAADHGTHVFHAQWFTAGSKTLSVSGSFAPPAGLTNRWSGNNVVGIGVVDSIRGATATMQGGVTVGPGPAGSQALVLNGNGAYLYVSDNPALNFGTGDFSVDLWANFNSTAGEQVLMEKYVETMNSATKAGWTLTKLSNNVIRFAMASNGSVVNLDSTMLVPSLYLPTNTWLHFAVTRAGGLVKVYLNGMVIAFGTFTGDLSSPASLKIGHRGDLTDTPGSTDTRGFYLNGSVALADLAVGTALSPTAVQSLYQDGIPPSSTYVFTNVAPGPLATLSVTSSSGMVAAGSPVAVTVTAEDAYGNAIPGYAGTVHFGSTDGQAQLPPDHTFTAFDAGSYTVSLTLDTAGNQTVYATDAAGGFGAMVPVQVTPAAASAARSTVTVTNPSFQAGGTTTVVLTAEDAYGNQELSGGLPISFGLGAGSSGGTFSAVTDNGDGTYTATFTATAAGSNTFTATVNNQPVTMAAPAVSVTPAAAARLALSPAGPATAGSAESVTVTAYDAFGNVAPGYTGTVHFGSSDARAGLPPDYTFAAADAGSHTFSVTFHTAGGQTLSAADTGTGSVQGSAGVQVTLAPSPYEAGAVNLLYNGYINAYYDYYLGSHSSYAQYSYAYSYYALLYAQKAATTHAASDWYKAYLYGAYATYYAQNDYATTGNTYAQYAYAYDYYGDVYANNAYSYYTSGQG